MGIAPSWIIILAKTSSLQYYHEGKSRNYCDGDLVMSIRPAPILRGNFPRSLINTSRVGKSVPHRCGKYDAPTYINFSMSIVASRVEGSPTFIAGTDRCVPGGPRLPLA